MCEITDFYQYKYSRGNYRNSIWNKFIIKGKIKAKKIKKRL